MIKKEMPQKIEISHRTIIFTVLFLIFLWFLYQIRQLLVILFVGLILMAALNPLIGRLEKLRIPRALAITLIYLLILVGVGLIVAGIIPPLVNQTSLLISRFPSYLESLGVRNIDRNIIDGQIDQLVNRLGSISVDVFRITISIFSNFLGVFTLILVSFYLLLERKNLDNYLLRIFGPVNKQRAAEIIGKVEKKLGTWVRAQITLMIIVGLMSYVGLRLLGIDFALPLALLSGLLEIIPNIGPTIAAIPAVIAGLGVSPIMALAVIALCFLVQQLENQIVVPQVMKKETGLNPLVTILSLIAGFRIGGALGAVLSIPLVMVIEVLLTEILASRKLKK